MSFIIKHPKEIIMTKLLKKTTLIYLITFLICLFPEGKVYCKYFTDDPSSDLMDTSERVLNINIFSNNNGKGLQTSRNILKSALLEMGHQVYERELCEKVVWNTDGIDDPKIDINIFFERINVEWLDYASTNWFIPNPEWYMQSHSLLDRIDLILCRTHEVERIFQSLNKETYYLGFSSLDCIENNNTITKDFTLFFHLAGGSGFKGTKTIHSAWRNNVSLPLLTTVIHLPSQTILQPAPNLKLITYKLPLDELRYTQNKCGVHLCLSETEGFGHYLMEAMSTGAVVLTTDAPPMNEFITDKRCLVAYKNISRFHLGIRYYADPESLRDTVFNLMTLSMDELKEIGDHNRAQYLLKKQEFHINLEKLIHMYLQR